MYQPSKEILDKYADLLVNFALNNGEGIKKGDVVLLTVPESAKPMLISLRRSVLKAGGHPLVRFFPDDMEREFFELANEEQISFFPGKSVRGLVDQVDHSIFIVAESDPYELKGIDPKKIMNRSKAFKPYMEWRDEKENKGEFFWTMALYGTPAMAKEAGLTLEEYWNEIIKACYLDEGDTINKWEEIFNEINRIRNKLNELSIKKLHIKSKSTDLIVGIGKNRQWLGGDGNNIPTFEIFITPDSRLTNGHIQFTEPLYRYGNLIKKAYLEFKDGKVVKVKAEEGEEVLKEMINTKNADKIGEFSLTDSRFSKITKFMATTLYDENVGGEHGNTHIALGKAYQASYPGDPSKVSKEEWEELGYNDSVVHTDIVSTENRKVTAYLEDGSTKLIYKDGKFTL